MGVSVIEIFRRLDFADFIKGTFTRNIKLKLLSLALAFVLWMYIRSETIDKVVLYNVEVSVRAKAAGMEVEPAKLKIERLVINGPKSRVQMLTSESPRGEVVLDRTEPGEVEIKPKDIRWTGFRHNSGILVDSNVVYSPNKVRVMRLTSKWVTVLPKLDEKSLAPGMQASATRANPQEVEIFGPEEALKRIDNVETEAAKVSVPFLTPTEISRGVRVKTPPGVRCETNVTVLTTIRPLEVQRQLENLDIVLLRNPADMNIIALTPPKVTLTFSGPKADVESLSNANVTVYLDLRNMDKAGEYKLPVQLNLPKGVSLLDKPPEIKVVVKITG